VELAPWFQCGLHQGKLWILMADFFSHCTDNIVIHWCTNTQSEVHRLPFVVCHQGNWSGANIMTHIHRISSVVSTKVMGCQNFICQQTLNTSCIEVVNRIVLEVNCSDNGGSKFLQNIPLCLRGVILRMDSSSAL